MKEDYQKRLKKSTFVFLPKPVPFKEQSYQKQRGPGTSAQSLSRLRKKFRKIPLLVISYLTKFDVIYNGCWVISKIVSANLCKPIRGMANYSTSICPLLSGKCGKQGKKFQKFEYLENKKSFFDEIKKTLFIVFEGLSFSGKTKIW